MSRVTAIISALVICIIVCLSWAVNHYRDNAIVYKEQRDKKVSELKQATATITDMQQRQRSADALDAKYTKELAYAKAENDALRRKLDNGGRVFVKGKCPVPSSAETSSASGMGNDATVELSSCWTKRSRYPGRNYPRPNSTENASGIHRDAMPSMIAIILLIILHIWLCRQDGDHFWSESRLNISLLMLDIEHLARGKGLR